MSGKFQMTDTGSNYLYIFSQLLQVIANNDQMSQIPFQFGKFADSSIFTQKD